MEHLHYFLVHPEKFDAAIPSDSFSTTAVKLQSATRTSPVLDLDKLIEMLEAVESKKITIPPDQEEDERDLSKEGENADDVVSETLAKIHAQQGRRERAIQMYERLIEINAEKKEHYRSQIDKLENTDSNDWTLALRFTDWFFWRRKLNWKDF